jgi:outer membrane lipoprotein-sorting protein
MIRLSAALVFGALALPLAATAAGALDATPQPATKPTARTPSKPALSQPAPPKVAPGAAVAQNLPAPVGPAARAAKPTGRPGVFDAQQRALVERVSTYLTSVQTMVGDFVQVGPDGRRTDGKFYIQKPGRIRFEYNPPSPLELISDGRSVAIRDRKLATQDLVLLSQTPLRFLLADRIDLLKEGNLVNVQTDDTFASVVLEEKQAIGGTHRLTLMFSAHDLQLKQWTVTDPQGYDTTVAVYNVDTAKKPDPGLFRINYERMRD